MHGLYSADIMVRRWRQHKKFYELDLLKQIEQRCLKGVYLDIGANLGNHSVFFANFCPCDFLIAVEAHPEIHQVLTNNLHDHVAGVCGYAAHNMAIASQGGYWHTPGEIDPSNVGSTHCVMEPGGGQGQVTSVSIDTLTAELTMPTAVIKIDIEGGEQQALAGARQTLKKHRPLLVLEAGHPSQVSALDTTLKPYNYKRVWRTKKNPASHIWEPQ